MFLHTFLPSSIFISLGPITVYWYGLFIVLGILSALYVSINLAARVGVAKETVVDLAFWLIVNGIVGARLYHIGLEYSYYFAHPLETVMLWQGGLAIHGAIIAGAITIWHFCRKNGIRFWQMTSLLAPGLALGQAIGRWGNYFNQELFGLPTDLPWGIPISPKYRPLEFYDDKFFHPTFLYESIGNLTIFCLLLIVFRLTTKDSKHQSATTIAYLLFYSALRFTLEFIKIDSTPVVLGWRWPQIVSMAIIIVISGWGLSNLVRYVKNKKALTTVKQ